MRKIIIDVDTGVDDAIAIILALLSTEVDVLGVTTVTGNRMVDETTENTLRVIDAIDVKCPVFKGVSQPLVASLDPKRKTGYPYKDAIQMHGDLLPLPPSVSAPQKRNAVSWIIDTLEKTEKPVTLVGLAPLTNFAFVLRIAPHLLDKIEEIYLLGGAYNTGNVTSFAEFNFWADPEAAKIVLEQPVPIKMVTINAAYHTKLSRNDFLRFTKIQRKIGSLMNTIVENSLKEQDPVTIYDALTVCALISPSVVQYTLMTADIDISGGDTDGQLIAASCAPEETNLSVALSADKNMFIQTIEEILYQQGEG